MQQLSRTLLSTILLLIASSAMSVETALVASATKDPITASATALAIDQYSDNTLAQNDYLNLSNKIMTQACPDHFYNVTLPNNGKLCQVFAADLPASMILFVPQTPKQVIQFYQQDKLDFTTNKQVKERFILQSADKNTTLIVSADGQGSQVDILVKSDNLN